MCLRHSRYCHIGIHSHAYLSTMDPGLLLEEVLKVTEQAAEFIRSQAGKVTAEKIEIKSKNSLVSFVDKQAEEMLVEGLSKIIEDAGFITEEETITSGKSEYTWIIDPLDGTTNFLHQIPIYSVSIGLLHEDEIILGVVCDIERKETFYAWKGGGAWCNGQSIHVSVRTEITDAVVATGFPYASKDVSPELMGIFDYFLKNARGIRRLGSAAIDLAYVACGRFDAYYETNLNAWDMAGGILLVREAGGTVTDFSSFDDMLESGQVIAAAPELHKTLAEEIGSFFQS